MTYATIGRAAQRVSQVMFLRHLARQLAYQAEAPTLWDVDFRTAVAQAELEDREQPAAYHKIHFTESRWLRRDRHRDHASRADPGVRGARGASGRPAIQAAVRDRRDHAAVRREGADQGARAGRSRKGQRHRDDLHLRRYHRRDVVARAEAAGARDRAAQRHARTGDVGTARLGIGRRRRARRPPTISWRGSPPRRRRRRSSSCCARAATCRASRSRSRTR